jgi:phosphosulfolactate phosphohydrolase-like enzyme
LYFIGLKLVSICYFSRSSDTFTCLEGIDRRSRSALEQSFLAALLEKMIREHANEDDNAHDGEVERARNSGQIDEVLQDLEKRRSNNNADDGPFSADCIHRALQHDPHN